ncbi:DapH/DapD/GlmU-related protein [Microbacterium kribbense]
MGVLKIGDNVFVNQGVRIHAESSVTIGSRVEIGDLVAIYDTDFHPVEPGAAVRTSPVRIGDDCWVCAGAIILPGVSLGRGTVVAAGAVVTKSSPVGALLAGNPARVIRQFEVPADYERR